MLIHRTAPTRAFSTYSNALLRDTRISWCASGLLTYLLSLPAQAHTDIRKLAGLRREGRDRIAGALRELEEARYLRRRRFNNPETGACCTEYEVYDTPYDGPEPDTGGPDPVPVPVPSSPPQAGNPAAGEPSAGTGPLRSAVALLGSLARAEPRLSLGTAEAFGSKDPGAKTHPPPLRPAVRLAPLVEEWRAAGASDATLRTALTSGLPSHVHAPAALLADRLRRKKPQQGAPQVPAPRPALNECEACRDPIPRPGRCRPCAGEAPPSAPPSALPSNGAEPSGGPAAVRAALRTRREDAARAVCRTTGV